MCDPFSLIPRGSDTQEHGERGSEGVLPVFSHSSLQIPLWTPWALTVTLFYPPWIINPFFLRSPQWARELWALFSYWEEESLRSLGIYPSCYPFKDKTSFDLSFRKLIETVQLVVQGQESWKKERKKKSNFAYSVNSLICFLCCRFKPSSISACKLIFGSGSSLKSYNEHTRVCQTSEHACASVGIQKEQSSRPWK